MSIWRKFDKSAAQRWEKIPGGIIEEGDDAIEGQDLPSEEDEIDDDELIAMEESDEE